VKRALNAVQKTGDEMTGNLTLRSDERMHFIIANADGSPRAYIYKDKGGDGLAILNVEGGGNFIFGKNGEFYSPGEVHAGSARLATDGDTGGAVWDGLLSAWLNRQFAVRDNNINARATIDWVRQTFTTANIIYLVQNGWFKDSSTGFLIQWGEVLRAGNGTWVNFPVAFPSTCLGIFLTLSNTPASLSSSIQNIHAGGRTLSGFTYYAADQEVSAFWLAIGR
ncbi:hypothetical protein SOP30_004419, partial [Salmonella enterica]|nr:hypothetical protein [Salmonella enterica]